MRLEAAVRDLFRPARDQAGRRVGLEIELIPHAGGRAVAPGELVRCFDPGFVAAAQPSFEPGGQLELSLPPSPTANQAVHRAVKLIDHAASITARRGIALELLGVDPRHDWWEVPLRTPRPRYLAMQQLLGPDGRRMMRLTASLQICVDLLGGDAGHQQWLVANLAGPALTSAFPNSPDTGPSRTAIWRRLDPNRTGYDGRHLDARDPIGAYLAFAAAAPRFPIPEAHDDRYHLTTLFPPVRPRGGYLEVRYLDAQPVARLGLVVGVLAALLYEPCARGEAFDLLLPRVPHLDTDWGTATAGVSAQRDDLLDIARRGMARLPVHYLSASHVGTWVA